MLKLMRQLSRQRQFSLLSTGDSMLPILKTGDLVYYRKTAYRMIKENDILLIHKNNKLFTHRVVYKTPSYLVTTGDNNQLSDGKIFPRNIIAKAVRLKRGKKTIPFADLYAMQSLLYAHEITRVVTSLKKAGVEAVILKGLPLHLHYEGKHPQRIYSDCDLLVTGKDEKKAAAVLIKNGYRLLRTELSTQHRLLKDKKTEDSYVKMYGNFRVVFDVHYEAVFMMTQLGRLDPLYPQSLIDAMTKEFLREKHEVCIQESRFPLLNEKHLVPYLMLHFFHHNFKGAFRLSFIYHIISKLHHNKDLFREMAQFITAYRLQGYVYPGFLLLSKYYRLTFPASFLQAIKPSPNQHRYINKHIMPITPFDSDSRVRGGVTRFKHLFYLSPGNTWKKSFVFLYPAVWYSVLWTLTLKRR